MDNVASISHLKNNVKKLNKKKKNTVKKIINVVK